MWRWLPMMMLLSCARDVAEGKGAVARGALLLDVRTADEFATGHLEGAVNLPVQELDARWSALAVPGDREVVVYCRSGQRSARAKTMLEAKGVRRVIDVGAMSNWR